MLLRLTATSAIGALAAVLINCGSDDPGPTEPTPVPPPASVGHALVYHDTLGQVILLNAGLGGPDDAQRIGRPTRLWGWNGTRWNLLDSLGPPIRNLAGAAYDSRRNVIVLVGGTASQSLNYGETWEWSRTGWTKRSDGGPGVRSHTQMAYDRVRGRSVVFGGQNADATQFPADTWEWDGTTWTRAATAGPPPRVHHAMMYDAIGNRILVFGGYQPNVRDLGDLWSWNGTSWTELPATAATRTHAQLGATPGSRAPVVVGGVTATGGATTMLTLDQNTWRSTTVDGPSPRYLPGVAYDAARSVLVLYGGGSPDGNTVYADTWEYDGTRWRRVP